MRINLKTEDGHNTLYLSGISLLDLDKVTAWLYALGMSLRERHDACCQLLGEGSFSFCNIEHKVVFECRR